jgi:hypothetical protein
MIKTLHPKRQKEPRKTMEKNFLMRETGNGKLAQLLDRYMMMMNIFWPGFSRIT